MALEFTDANFEEEVLKSTVPAFVDFWAPWCGPCQMMGPIVEEVSHEMAERAVKIGKINVDDHQVTAGTYKVLSIPTFLMFKGGHVVDTLVGGVSKEKIKEFISKQL